mmetsp:Transcript_24279/g.45918  ORF Transcript_24279/g.45918 Transcript_24279/m.45918 type:complete len:227 (-) Transcript_24279:174-854(-)
MKAPAEVKRLEDHLRQLLAQDGDDVVRGGETLVNLFKLTEASDDADFCEPGHALQLARQPNLEQSGVNVAASHYALRPHVGCQQLDHRGQNQADRACDAKHSEPAGKSSGSEDHIQKEICMLHEAEQQMYHRMRETASGPLLLLDLCGNWIHVAPFVNVVEFSALVREQQGHVSGVKKSRETFLLCGELGTCHTNHRQANEEKYLGKATAANHLVDELAQALVLLF